MSTQAFADASVYTILPTGSKVVLFNEQRDCKEPLPLYFERIRIDGKVIKGCWGLDKENDWIILEDEEGRSGHLNKDAFVKSKEA